MADLEKTVSIIFDGDNTRVKSVLGDTSNDMTAFSGKLTGIATAAAGITTAVAAIGTAFVLAMEPLEQAEKIIANTLTLTPEEESQAIAAIRRVYTAGFGESYADAATAAAGVIKTFADDAAVDLEKITTGALLIRDTFGIDVNESLSAVRTLMQQFGVTADEAFGFIVQGAQNGINNSDDLIDTINEYAVQFGDAQFSAEEFYRVLATGYQEGTTLGTDKVADLIKEFKIRLEEGATATATAYGQIGINFNDLITDIDNGTITIATAFDKVVEELGNIPSRTAQFQIGQEIFGTQFEDLGASLVTGLTDAVGAGQEAFADAFNGMIDENQQTLGEKFGILGRTALDAFTGSWIGQNTGDMVGGIVDFLTQAIKSVTDSEIEESETLIARIEKEMADVQALMDDTPLVYKTEIDTDYVADQLAEVETVPMEIEAKVRDEDGLTLEEMTGAIAEAFGDPTEKKIEVDADTEAAKTKIEKVNEEADKLNASRIMQIELQGEIDTQIAQIKTTAETAQAAFEWKAKVDIAQVQADTEVIKTMFASVDTAINSTGETLVGLFGLLTGDNLDIRDKWNLRDAIEDEQKYRDKAFAKQSELIDAQVDLMNARRDALERGDGLIKIDSSGLEPALELVMWEILEKVQVRASENVQEFLLGI